MTAILGRAGKSALVLAYRPDPEWTLTAACRGGDPEVFFSKDTTEAKAFCARCPVLEACRRFALRNAVPDGVWGGLTEDERKALSPG